MEKQVIDLDEAKKDLEQIIDIPISRVWRGYGTAVFWEIGDLHTEFLTPKRKTTVIKGKWTLALYGAWRVIQNHKIVIDALLNEYRTIDETITQLVGLRITSFDITVNAAAIVIKLDTGISIRVENGRWGLLSLGYNSRKEPFHLVLDRDGDMHREYYRKQSAL